MVLYYFNSHAYLLAVMANAFKLRFLVVTNDVPQYVPITRCVVRNSIVLFSRAFGWSYYLREYAAASARDYSLQRQFPEQDVLTLLSPHRFQPGTSVPAKLGSGTIPAPSGGPAADSVLVRLADAPQDLLG